MDRPPPVLSYATPSSMPATQGQRYAVAGRRTRESDFQDLLFGRDRKLDRTLFIVVFMEMALD